MSETNSNRKADGDSETQPPNNIASSSSSSNNLTLALSSIYRGFKFEPSDIDSCFYLDLFYRGYGVLALNIPVHRVNIYESTPEQLSNEYAKGNEKEWFFITERTRRSEGGKNLIRTDNSGGIWKGTQKGQEVEDENGLVVGYRTALQYHTVDKAKGDWLMLEYSSHLYGPNHKVDYALCKIYLTPKGASKRKAEEAEDEKKKKMKIEEVIEAPQQEIDQPQQLEASQQQQHELDQPELDVASQPKQDPLSDAFQVPYDYVAHYWDEYEPQLLELDGFKESMNLSDFLDDEFQPDWSFLDDLILTQQLEWSFLDDLILQPPESDVPNADNMEIDGHEEELKNGYGLATKEDVPPLDEPLQEPLRTGESSQNQSLDPNVLSHALRDLFLEEPPAEEGNEYEGLLIDNPHPLAVRGIPNIY